MSLRGLSIRKSLETFQKSLLPLASNNTIIGLHSVDIAGGGYVLPQRKVPTSNVADNTL